MDPRLRRIADVLLAQSDATAVDPASIDPQLLPYLYIVEVERDLNIRLRVRFVGSALEQFFQRPVVGHLLEEFIHGPRGRDVIASFHHCAKTQEPIWMRQVVCLPDQVPRFVEGVAVYLSPNRIYGALAVGELSLPTAESNFERISLKR